MESNNAITGPECIIHLRSRKPNPKLKPEPQSWRRTSFLETKKLTILNTLVTREHLLPRGICLLYIYGGDVFVINAPSCFLFV